MYCSTCGSLINTELNYCNRCGARVDKLTVREKSPAVAYLSIATGFVGLGGLSLTVGLIAILLANGTMPAAVVVLGLAFLLTVFGMTFLMLRQISQISNALPPVKEKLPENQQLNSAPAAQLAEPRPPARSVTENTTRTLEKDLVE
jgi:hypothetical protein